MTDRREVIPWHISKLKDVFTSPAACLRCRIKCHSKAVQMPFEYHSGRDCKGLRRGSSESPSIPRHRSWKRRKRFWKRPPLSCPAFPSLQGDCGFFFSLCSIPPRVWFPRTGTVRQKNPSRGTDFFFHVFTTLFLPHFGHVSSTLPMFFGTRQYAPQEQRTYLCALSARRAFAPRMAFAFGVHQVRNFAFSA